jgi:hypothetical protein
MWQAPEVLDHAQTSPAADMYAWGCLVWELFTRDHLHVIAAAEKAAPAPAPAPAPAAAGAKDAVVAVVAVAATAASSPSASSSASSPSSRVIRHPLWAALRVLRADGKDEIRPPVPDYVPEAYATLIRKCWLRVPGHRPLGPDVLPAVAHIRAAGIPKHELNVAGAAQYRKKQLVQAFPSAHPVVVSKSWGSGQSKPGDWIIVGPNDDVYTCDAAIFQRTYVRGACMWCVGVKYVGMRKESVCLDASS